MRFVRSASERGAICSNRSRRSAAPVAFHEHHGDSECYHILSGAGEYDDNGVKRMVKPGDVTWTPDGTGHGLSNAAGREDLVFIALMIKS